MEPMKSKVNTILASSSPRRLELLKLINVFPKVEIPEIEEKRKDDESMPEFVKRIAIEKGEEVRRRNDHRNLIVSADTIVFIKNRIIGKPEGRKDAFEMLSILSGEVHEVITGVSLLYNNKCIFDMSYTSVKFSKMSEFEINYYLDNENWSDKAGAYAIQGIASIFIERIEGCYFNVMGFPINMFYNMIKETGVNFIDITSNVN